MRSARADEQVTLSSLLRDHLGVPSAERAVVEEAWPRYEHVNVQAGIDAWLTEGPVTHRLVGVIGFQHHEFGLAELLAPSEQMAYGPRPGNVARVNVASGAAGQVSACVLCGLYLITVGDRRAAVLLRAGDRHEGLAVQVVSTDDEYALQVAAEIRELAVVKNVFRRQVLSFGGEVFGHEGTLLQFHAGRTWTSTSSSCRPRPSQPCTNRSSRWHVTSAVSWRQVSISNVGCCSTAHQV